MRHSKLTPVSHLTIEADTLEWYVVRDYLRLSKYPVRVYAHGMTREIALRRFENELIKAEKYQEIDVLQIVFGWLYDLGGIIDSVSRWIKAPKDVKHG